MSRNPTPLTGASQWGWISLSLVCLCTVPRFQRLLALVVGEPSPLAFSAFSVGFHEPGVPSHICQTDPRSRSKMDADYDIGAKVESSYDPVENGHLSFLVTQERCRHVMHQGSQVKMPWRGNGERVVVICRGPSWPGLRTRVYSGGDGLGGPVSTSEHSRYSALRQRLLGRNWGVS